MNEEFYQTEREMGLYRTCWDIYPKLLKKVKLEGNEKILDAGCGNGELAKHIKSLNLYGFDFDERAVKIAQKAGYKKVVRSDIYHIPFKDKEFDKTFCIEVIEYLSEPERAFEELMRVTKGEIILSSANFNWYKLKSLIFKNWRIQYKNQLKMNKNFINPGFFMSLARKYGLKVKIEYVSDKSEKIRNLFGNYLSGEVIGIFKLK